MKKIRTILLTAVATISLATATLAQVPNYVPTNGLVGWWPFNGNANDVSGNGNNGIVFGATLTMDRFGNPNKAFNFNGLSDYISIPDNNSLDFTTAYSISVWVQIPDYSTPQFLNVSGAKDPIRTILGKPRNAGWASGYYISSVDSGASNKFSHRIGTDFNQSFVLSNAPLPLNTWVNIVAVKTSSNLLLYKNGVLEQSTSSSLLLTNSSEPLYIGKEFTSLTENWYRYFKGKADDIGIWNRALTAQEVTSLYTTHAQNPYPIIPIDTIQFVNSSRLAGAGNTLPDYISPVFKNSTYGDTVRFEGVVTTNPRIYGLSTLRKAAYIQRIGGGAWSGVSVMCEPSGTGTTLANLIAETKFYDNFIVGQRVRVTGVIRDFQGETQVNLIRNSSYSDNSVQILSLNLDSIKFTTVQLSNLMMGNPNTIWTQQKQSGERWEGTNVQINNVTVYSISSTATRSFWTVLDDFGNLIEVRDMSGYYRRDDNEDTVPKILNTFQPPPVGTRLEYIRGVITENALNGVQRYGIAPFYPGDVKVCTSCPPIVKYIRKTPIVLRSNDTLDIFYEIAVGDTTLKSNRLFYRRGNAVMDSVDLIELSGFPNTYSGRINPPHTADQVISYWVKAEDWKNRATISPDPFTIGGKLYVTSNGIRSISTLQFSPFSNNSSIWNGDTIANDAAIRINVPAIVTSHTFGSGLMTIQSGTGPNSAIFVLRSANDSASNWETGDSILITAANVRENSNLTTLHNVRGNLITKGVSLPPFQMNLPIDSFALNKSNFSSKWEGVLVRFDSVKVANKNPDAPSNFSEFTFNKSGNGIGMRVDDLNSQLTNVNQIIYDSMPMSFIQGPIYYSFGNYKIIPRGNQDIDLSGIDTIAPILTLNGSNPATVKLDSIWVDPGARAIDNIWGDISSRITVSGNVNTSIKGSYSIMYKVEDFRGNKDSVFRDVIVSNTLPLNIISDTLKIIYKSDSALLAANSGYTNYKWSTGDTTSSVYVKSSGWYYLQADSVRHSGTDSIRVIIFNGIAQQQVNLCKGDTAYLSVKDTDKTFLWSTNETNRDIKSIPTITTTYSCVINYFNYSFIDSVRVMVRALPNNNITYTKRGLCKNDTISLSANSGYNYTWKRDNTTVGFTQTLKSSISGNYTVDITDSFGCKNISDIVNLFYAPLPKAIATVNDSIQCLIGNKFQFKDSTLIDSGSYSITWRFGGVESNQSKPTYSYSNAGNFQVKLITISAYGCSDSTSLFVTVNNTPVTGVILGDSVYLTAGNTYVYTAAQQLNHQYEWLITNGMIINGQGTNIASVRWLANGSGKIQCSVTNSSGCTDTSNLIVDVGVTPSIVSFSPTSANAGATVTINGVNFTGATAVKFGGVNAQSFSVVSATQITAIVDTGATGSVTVETPNGNATLTGFTFLGSTGINESVVKDGVIIYPNPVSTILNIQFNKPGNYVVKLRNTLGQTYATNTTTGMIDVSGLANGVYILTVYDTHENLVSTNKILIIK